MSDICLTVENKGKSTKFVRSADVKKDGDRPDQQSQKCQNEEWNKDMLPGVGGKGPMVFATGLAAVIRRVLRTDTQRFISKAW